MTNKKAPSSDPTKRDRDRKKFVEFDALSPELPQYLVRFFESSRRLNVLNVV